MIDTKWSKQEKKLARMAFDNAYQRECRQIIEEIRNSKLEEPQDIWKLCDMLNDRRKEIDRIYDYRYSQLISVY